MVIDANPFKMELAHRDCGKGTVQDGLLYRLWMNGGDSHGFMRSTEERGMRLYEAGRCCVAFGEAAGG